MTPESFENQLAQVPVRDLPSEWKDEILAHAGSKNQRFGLTFPFNWRGLLWPSPRAWTALAVLWMGITGLNIAGPRGEALYACASPTGNSPEFSPAQYTVYAHVRSRLLIELFEPTSPIPDLPSDPPICFRYEIR